MTPKYEAIAFRIWQYASPRDWRVSYDELAEELALTYSQVYNAIRAKGWGGKVMSATKSDYGKRSMAMLHMRNGHRFDENTLDLCDLIR